MIDRGGQAAEVGRLLLMHAEIVFGWWHWVREGRWKRATFQRRLPWLRRSLRAALDGGTWSPCVQTEATCRELLRVEPALWTFVRVEGVEPTNNAAEVRLVGQKPSTHSVREIDPGTLRRVFLGPQNLIPVSV